VNSAIAVVKQKMTDSRRQFFAAVKKSEFQGLHYHNPNPKILNLSFLICVPDNNLSMLLEGIENEI
jgi:hypothetical protein